MTHRDGHNPSRKSTWRSFSMLLPGHNPSRGHSRCCYPGGLRRHSSIALTRGRSIRRPTHRKLLPVTTRVSPSVARSMSTTQTIVSDFDEAFDRLPHTSRV